MKVIHFCVLASFIPSILALIQGISEQECRNFTKTFNETSLKPELIKPNFSVGVYFIFMCLLLCVSTGAFTALNYTKVAKNSRKPVQLDVKGRVAKMSECSSTPVLNDSINKTPFSPLSKSSSISSFGSSEIHIREINAKIEQKNKIEQYILLTIIFFVSFICYGVLPGLQSYSTLPYGNSTFHFAVNLSNFILNFDFILISCKFSLFCLGFLLLPISIFLSIWSYYVSIEQIIIEFFIAILFSIYIIVLAATSPCPVFINTKFLGSFLTVISWILTQSMFMRVRCLVATRLERFGQRTLLILGFFTMFGQIFGGVLVYLLDNVYGLLKNKPQCTNIADICPNHF
jgi:hypothetical protein